MLRLRTVWDWRLRLYPLIALLLALILWARDVSFVADRQVRTSPSKTFNELSDTLNVPVVSATPCCVCFEGKIVQRFCWRLTEERR